MRQANSTQIRWRHTLFPLFLVACLFACVHEPVLPHKTDNEDTLTHPGDTLPPDTTGVDTSHQPPDTTGVPVDTTTTDTSFNPSDTTSMTSNNCHPDTAYFNRDILPVLIYNCAVSGCHDSASAKAQVVLNSYENVIQTGKVIPGDLFDSRLYRVLIESNPNQKMPPPMSPQLDNEQILIIQSWILQGALDNQCGDTTYTGNGGGTGGGGTGGGGSGNGGGNGNGGSGGGGGGGGNNGCDTTNVSYSQTVKPILNDHCIACHNSNGASGDINLSSHAGVSHAAASGKLYGAIAHLGGYEAMPKGGNKLADCDIQKIKAWIDAGTPNN